MIFVLLFAARQKKTCVNCFYKIMKHIALILALAVSSLHAEDWQPEKGFTSLFNGKDLTGWCFRAKTDKKDPAPGNITEKHDGKTADGRCDRITVPWCPSQAR